MLGARDGGGVWDVECEVEELSLGIAHVWWWLGEKLIEIHGEGSRIGREVKGSCHGVGSSNSV